MRFTLLFMTMSLFGQTGSREFNAHVRKLNFEQLEPSLHHINDTVYLVNFWATWCGPCRAEMPLIEKAGEKYSAKKFRILLVSLDFPNQMKERLLPYISANHIKSEVVLLDDPDQNRWIDKVDPKWDGELPFTIIYGRNFRESFARTFGPSELDSIINAKLNTP